MARAYKILGQSAPSATTATTLYTVPSSTYTVVSTITVANRGTSNATYRIAIRPDGDTLANQHYIAYDATILANDTVALTLGITVDSADVITVYASSANLSFNAFGSEIDE
jgi:glucose-6-phosphate dehydrogenase assembly protein OpcA